MGKIKNGILGCVSGKAGSVSGSRNLAGEYIKGSVANYHDAKSEKQVAHRTKFKAVASFAKHFGDSPIATLWKNVDPKISWLASFIKANIDAFSDNGEIQDYSKICMSKGKSSLPSHLSVEKIEGRARSLNISWRDNSVLLDDEDDFSKETLDIVFLGKGLALDDGLGFLCGVAKRNDESFVLNFEELFEAYNLNIAVGSIIEMYLYFSNPSFRNVTSSVYFELEL